MINITLNHVIFAFLVANLTLPTNVTSFGGLFGYTNNVLGGIFGLGIFAVVIIISLLGAMFMGNSIGASLVYAGVISLFVGFGLLGLNVLPSLSLIGSLALIVIGAFVGMGNNATRPY